MDEPTSSLSSNEIESLFRIIRKLQDQGVAFIYISHRMEEIFEIGNRISVMKDGAIVQTASPDSLTVPRIVESMSGRAFDDVLSDDGEDRKEGDTLLQVSGLSATGLRGTFAFAVHTGEILGIAGLAGSGRSRLALALFGRWPATEGEIRIHGKRVDVFSSRAAMDNKIGMIAEDRKRQALYLDASVCENMTFNSLRNLPSRPWVGWGAQLRLAEERMDTFDMHPRDPRKRTRELSGGTQQKAVLANWLFEGFDVLIMDEPTRGVDVQARTDIFRIIRRWASKGVGILVISSELSELAVLCDRVLVMHEGRQVGILEGEDVNEKTILEKTFMEKQ